MLNKRKKFLDWQKIVLVIYPLYQGAKFAFTGIGDEHFSLSVIIRGILWLVFTTVITAFLFWIGNKIFKVKHKNIENDKDHDIVTKALKILLTILITGVLVFIFLDVFNYLMIEVSILLSALATATVFFMIVMCIVIIGRILGKPLKRMFKWAIITLSATYGF